MEQEQIIRIQMMEQEVNQLNQQLQMIEQNIKELGSIVASLDEIDKGKNILANLGKSIFVPVEIKDDKLIVEVGKGNFVKKSITDTKKVIETESGKMMEGKNQIMKRLQDIQEEMAVLFNELQNKQMAESGKKDSGIEDLTEDK